VSGCEEDDRTGANSNSNKNAPDNPSSRAVTTATTANTVPSTFATSVDDADRAPVKQQQQQQQQQKKNAFASLSKSCDNSPVPAMSASRRKSFKDNMESLVRRLERELADGDDAAAARSEAKQRTCPRTLTRANGTQTMPVGGLSRGDGGDIAPFTFRRVYVVDEPFQQEQQQQQQHGHRPRVPSTSSTPNSSSADNSSASDCSSSDTVSEFSIDSSSDRSSIISLEDSLDHHTSSSSSSSSSLWCRPNLLQQQTRRLDKTSASCLNVWSTSGGGGKRKWPKECSGAVARAMSQFANGCGAGAECRPAARLKVFDGKTGGDACTLRDKRCVGLELMRERNGNVVVIREIKANGSSRYARCSELKCESVQSRIRKLQVHKGGAGGVQIEKSANLF